MHAIPITFKKIFTLVSSKPKEARKEPNNVRKEICESKQKGDHIKLRNGKSPLVVASIVIAFEQHAMNESLQSISSDDIPSQLPLFAAIMP